MATRHGSNSVNNQVLDHQKSDKPAFAYSTSSVRTGPKRTQACAKGTSATSEVTGLCGRDSLTAAG